MPVAAASPSALAVMAPVELVPYVAPRAAAAVHMTEMFMEAVLTLPLFVAGAAIGCTVAPHLIRTNQKKIGGDEAIPPNPLARVCLVQHGYCLFKAAAGRIRAGVWGAASPPNLLCFPWLRLIEQQQPPGIRHAGEGGQIVHHRGDDGAFRAEQTG